MNDHTDIERVLERWFDSGPTAMPDRVAVVVADRIGRQRQQRPWRLPWRVPTMSTPIKLILAAGALLAVVLGGAILSSSGVGPGPAPSPSPSSAATPTLAPSPAVAPTPLPATMEVQGDAASWTVTIPDGWTSLGGSRLAASQGYAGPTGVSIGASGAVNVPSDPCDGFGKVSDAASPADVVAELEAREDLVVSDPVATTIGGYAGTWVDVEMPADLSACGEDYYILFAEPDGSGTPALGPSNRFRVWIVDVEGRPVVFWIASFPETPAEDMATAQQIIDSIQITP